MSRNQNQLRAVCDEFFIYGDYLVAVPFGTGHINDTYQVTYDQGGIRLHYTLQRINTSIFKKPEELMENFSRVTTHMLNKIISAKLRTVKRTIRLLSARNGKPFVVDAEGNYWRAYIFIENARTYDIIESEMHAFKAARTFGDFQNDLVDLPGARLNETIPDFHNTPKRLEALNAAVKADICGRLKDVGPELDFIMARAGDCSRLVDLCTAGDIPERITHNDTKLNNILIDDVSGEGICVIDLDTVMPGLVHYDFGDMVRTGTSPAAEDERDLSKVTMRFEMFEALLRGYLASADKFLNPCEREELPFAGKLITLENGIRFLTDYLQGDTYFKTHRPNHNLDRCRTQLKLVSSIEEQFDAMHKLLKDIGPRSAVKK
ncbi:MAG: aminoglycoside phosphotransferase family protein [Lentisphaeria bacterium]|nr:aminoglycoside phosphotransferase family protein [Lentisphaeria bacterium]